MGEAKAGCVRDDGGGGAGWFEDCSKKPQSKKRDARNPKMISKR
jgi:hypothetical protein